MQNERYFVVAAPGYYGDRARVVSSHSSKKLAQRAAGKGEVVRRGDKRKGDVWLRSSERVYPSVEGFDGFTEWSIGAKAATGAVIGGVGGNLLYRLFFRGSEGVAKDLQKQANEMNTVATYKSASDAWADVEKERMWFTIGGALAGAVVTAVVAAKIG